MNRWTLLVVSLIVFAFGLGPSMRASAQVEVQVVNPPAFPVPVLPTDIPIPLDLIELQRPICTAWEDGRIIQDDGSRRLTEFRANVPRLPFPYGVHWEGELEGWLLATEEHLSIGWASEIKIITTCGGRQEERFTPQLDPATLNVYRINEELDGLACTSGNDGRTLMRIIVLARVLEFKGIQNDLPAVPPAGDGEVCLSLRRILQVR